MKRWLDSWSVSENEPTWPQVVVAGVLFVGGLSAMFVLLWLLAPAGAAVPR